MLSGLGSIGHAAAAGRGLRVLAADDDPRLVGLVALVLRRAGHRVETVSSAEEALGRLAAAPADVVVSDLEMGPGMDGLQLAATIRRRWPRTRVVLATGLAKRVDLASPAGRCVDVLLAKPFSPRELIAAVAGQPR